MTLAPGSSFGPYKILETLGRGGMASVFKAYEPGLDRYVALKVLPAQSVQDEASAERFRREAKVIARLEHPNITPIHNFGIDDASQIPWMAMRLISGGTLSSRLTMRMTPQRAVAILRGVADALDYAHGRGVMHRDVKPANILLDEAGRVYLADFGIARLVEGATALTAAGLISGTPTYMAPEQATGLALDHRVDIYALGVVAYEVLAGKVPFAADNPIDVLMKHVQAPVPVIPDLPAPLMETLQRALAKKPQDRWESAGALVTALEGAISQMPAVGASPTEPGMAALPITAAGAVVTTAAAAQASIPTRRHEPLSGAGAPPTVVATPRRSPGPTPPARRGPGASVIALVIGGVAILGLAGLFALYYHFRTPAPAAVTADGATGTEPATVPPGSMATRSATAVTPAPPVTTAPPAPAVGRETTGTPATVPARAAVVTTPPAVDIPVRRPAIAPVAETPVPVVTPPQAVAVGTLRLDVNAVQPAFGSMAGSLAIEVRVDGETLKTVSLTFEGTTPFARSRRRQAFEIQGVRAGDRALTVVVRADGGLGPLEATTRVPVKGDATSTAALTVRLRGNGEGDASFR